MGYKCEHCSKKFVYKKDLIRHQRTAKKCLAKQGKPLDGKFECNVCGKKFTQKHSMVGRFDQTASSCA